MTAADIERTYGRTIPPIRYISGLTLKQIIANWQRGGKILSIRITQPIKTEGLYCVTPDGVWEVD